MSKIYHAVLFSESGTFYYSRGLGVHRIANILRETFNWNVLVIDHFTLTQCHDYYKNVLNGVVLSKVLGPETRLIGFSTTFMNFNNSYLLDKIKIPNKSEHPIVVGTIDGLPFPSDRDAENFLSKLKTMAPNAKLVMGGTKSENRKYLNHIDAHVIGYGESQLIDLINYWDNKNKFFPVKKLSNTCLEVSHDPKGTFYDFTTKPTKYTEDDIIQDGETLPLEIARGCIFRCKFCAFPLNGKKKTDYIKNSNVLREEFIENYDKWGSTNYIIVDDTFNDSVDKLEMFNDVVQSLPFKIQYGAYLRHDLISAHPRMVGLLKDSGLVQASFGIETLNHESGKAIGKGMHPDKSIEVLHMLREKWPDVNLFSGFIIGLPYDTEDTIYKMLDTITPASFPLDGMNIVPLWIDPTAPSKKLFFSEFESNWSDYGYTFPENNTNWTLGNLTYKMCNKIAIKYQDETFNEHRNKISAFDFLSVMNYGYTATELKGLSRKKFNEDNNNIKQRLTFVNNYYQRLLKLIR
jgi:hypothetical protein